MKYQVADLLAAGVRQRCPLDLSTGFHDQGINIRVLNLGGGNVDTGTPRGGKVFNIMAALAPMELEIKRERITDSVSKRHAAGKDLGGRRASSPAVRSGTQAGSSREANPPTHLARDLGMSRATLYRRIAEFEAQQGIGTPKLATPAVLVWVRANANPAWRCAAGSVSTPLGAGRRRESCSGPTALPAASNLRPYRPTTHADLVRQPKNCHWIWVGFHVLGRPASIA